MTSLGDAYATAGLALIQSVYGEPCTYTPVGGAPIPITVSVAHTVPQIIAIDEHGQQSDRIINLIVPMAQVATPSRGDTYQLTSASNTGLWFATKVERGDQAGWLVSVRYQTHDAITGKGALEVRP